MTPANHARIQSHAAASCSGRSKFLAIPPIAAASHRLRGRAVVCSARRSAAQQQQQQQRRQPAQPLVVYLQDFLDASEFERVAAEAFRLRPSLTEELNCIATGRLGCYLPPDSDTVAIFSAKPLAARLTKALSAPFPLWLSAFPLELRNYPAGASMPWHTDEAMYASPQWEIIYTVTNNSDSRTEWRDGSDVIHSTWTEPNSLLAVQAEGWEHRVLPVVRGSRSILKMAFTSSNITLPAFDANLSREAYKER